MSDLLDRAGQLEDAMVDAVQALVTVESPSDDIEACSAVVQEAIGIFSGWLPSPARVEEHAGRPVWRWGADSPRVLLLGHLDTVWPMGTLARLPFAREGDRLRGPGIFDMKAGVVQGWAALALANADDSRVGMLLTTDEEIGSPSSRGVIATAINQADAVFVLEPSVEGALKSSRKGTSWYVLDFEGRASHAGLDPERGINAMLAAATFATEAAAWNSPAEGTTVTPTVLHSGTTSNTVPAHAQLTIDVRAWTRAEQERIDGLMRARAHAAAPARCDVSGGIDRPAMEAAASADLLATAQRVAAALGLPALQHRAVGGASDGNLTAAAGVRTLDGLGAVGDGAHADHEWASITGMIERAALLAGLIEDLT